MGREAAKISALASNDLLEKYEYLTGEDLGNKPSVFEKTKFEYSPLGMSLSLTRNSLNWLMKQMKSEKWMRKQKT